MSHPPLPLRCPGCGDAFRAAWAVLEVEGRACPRCGTQCEARDGIVLPGGAAPRTRGKGAGRWDLEVFERGYARLPEYRDNLEHARMSGIPEVAERYRYERVKGWIVREFMRTPGAFFLDVGAGSGFMLYQLKEWFPARRLRFAAADVSEQHLRTLARRAAEDAPRFVYPVRTDAEDLAVPDNTFDGVTCSEVIEHVFDKPRALAEMARVLRPGGVLLLTTPRGGMVRFWNMVFALPRRLSRALRGKTLWPPCDEAYDVPIDPGPLRRMVRDAGLRVEEISLGVCLPHEAYLQFLPLGLVRAWVRAAEFGERFGLDRVLGLHMRLRARKPGKAAP